MSWDGEEDTGDTAPCVVMECGTLLVTVGWLEDPAGRSCPREDCGRSLRIAWGVLDLHDQLRGFVWDPWCAEHEWIQEWREAGDADGRGGYSPDRTKPSEWRRATRPEGPPAAG